MLVDVVEVRAVGAHRMFVRFEDGVSGELDLDEMVRWEGVFAPLLDDNAFRQVRVNPELGCVEWPHGADLDSEVLYAKIAQSVPASAHRATPSAAS